MNIQQMMKQAAKMQDQVQKQAAQTRAEGTAGGGAVTVVINGLKQVQARKKQIVIAEIGWPVQKLNT